MSNRKVKIVVTLTSGGLVEAVEGLPPGGTLVVSRLPEMAVQGDKPAVVGTFQGPPCKRKKRRALTHNQLMLAAGIAGCGWPMRVRKS